MKRRLLDLIVCPECRGSFTLSLMVEQESEIMEGELQCPAGHRYPILRGVPRFVTSENYAGSFGFQWNQFSRVQLDIYNATRESEETLLEKTDFTREALKDRLVLDAGVGAGRFSDVVSRWDAEVCAIDLSTAIDAAFDNIGSRENVHLLQADLFRLPFPDTTFDFIFSIGVLHHTPDTRRAFESLIPLLKNDGQISIWVYSAHSEWKKVSDTLRRMTTRMPRKLIYYGSAIAVPLYYLKPLRTIFQGVFRLCMHKNWRWRWLDTFDYFTPAYQWKHTYPEVFSWFQECGLHDIKPLPAPVSYTGRK